MNKHIIGFEEARTLTLGSVQPLPTVVEDLENLVGRVLAEDMTALVDCPSCDTSRKEGFAVVSSDVIGAGREKPIRLNQLGKLTAGTEHSFTVRPGTTVEVTTGAPIPEGAEAVLAVEFTRSEGDTVLCFRDAEPGRNVLKQGEDIRAGETVAGKGRELTPSAVGLLAAAGVHRARVYPYPCVSVISTGDEVVAPGRPLRPGLVYASNLAGLVSWLKIYGMSSYAEVVGDSKNRIRDAVERYLEHSQAIITVGGAWKSEKDLVVAVMEEMGWQEIYRGVRMSPGKATSFGLLGGKPVFCLSGSPSSAETAFLHIVLPALLTMAGIYRSPFPVEDARLVKPLTGDKNWTHFYQAKLSYKDDKTWVEPLACKSKLKAMAASEAVIILGEGKGAHTQGEIVKVQRTNSCSIQVMPI